MWLEKFGLNIAGYINMLVQASLTGRGRPTEKSFLAFGHKMGSSVGVKSH